MVKIIKSIHTAEDNRLKCSYCEEKIVKGSNYFREYKSRWRQSFTINICKKCATMMCVKMGIDDNEIIQMKKEMMLMALEDEK